MQHLTSIDIAVTTQSTFKFFDFYNYSNYFIVSLESLLKYTSLIFSENISRNLKFHYLNLAIRGKIVIVFKTFDNHF